MSETSDSLTAKAIVFQTLAKDSGNSWSRTATHAEEIVEGWKLKEKANA